MGDIGTTTGIIQSVGIIFNTLAIIDALNSDHHPVDGPLSPS